MSQKVVHEQETGKICEVFLPEASCSVLVASLVRLSSQDFGQQDQRH